MPDKTRSPLNRHKKVGKKLIPPLKQLNNLKFTSWTNRLPEYLHATLLTANLSQTEYLQKFRLLVEYFAYSEEDLRPDDLSLSSLGKCNENYLFTALNSVFNTEKLKNVLKPLLLFEGIPAYPVWKDLIGTEPDESDWEMLQTAIGKTLYHNSQESTDIRWFCVFYQIACKKISFPKNLEEELEMIIRYPCIGDLREVRPIIRSMESGMYLIKNHRMESSEWVKLFWDTCLFETSPIGLVEKPKPKNKLDEKFAKRLSSIWKKLYEAFYATLETSAIDAKHDASFGLVMYSLRIVTDSFNRNIGTYLIGRIVLRSLVENYITLAYLVKKDKKELWQDYRKYGAGQAKLVSLKADNYESIPPFISLEDINKISNEDMREEFVDILLGHWAGSNLRQMSIESNTKEIYDKYYDWTSGYLHGNWGAVRDSIYLTDFNPLHRLMRIPLPKRNFNDVMVDMIEIMNLQLSLIYELYGIKELKI